MDKYQIGMNAGIVWNKLKDNAHWDYKQLKAATGLTDRDLNAISERKCLHWMI